ncbi:hypothetical protein R5R35_008028 [Gryllus longicercus]|uniref:Uncharacterized protein n=1 Tax=Gryllus longicercus TaxID=2509291 RepID=A0AAN9ZCR9_9ORTH
MILQYLFESHTLSMNGISVKNLLKNASSTDIFKGKDIQLTINECPSVDNNIQVFIPTLNFPTQYTDLHYKKDLSYTNKHHFPFLKKEIFINRDSLKTELLNMVSHKK